MHISEKDKDLFNELLNESESEDDTENNNLCLITQQPLAYNSITLKCNHKFNYDAILDEVIVQKTTRNPLNITILKRNELQCPYCRIIHTQLLPFVSTEKHTKRISGVSGPKHLCMPLHTCKWIFKTGKKKGCVCGKEAYETENGVFCKMHHKINKPKEEFLSWNEEMEGLKSLTVENLKAILHERKLKKTGNKTTLIQRIVTDKKLYTT